MKKNTKAAANIISEFCERHNITKSQFSGKSKIGRSLYLGSVTSIPQGFNPTVGGDLDLGSVTSIPQGFNPTVGGYLYLGSVTSIPQGFNPTVGGDLYLRSVTSIPQGFNPTVGGYLDLRSVTSIPHGFNPTVGGDLYLRSVTSIPQGFNPTVGGDLDLGSVTSIPQGFNPTVGGDLYLGSVTSIPQGFNPTVGGDLYLRSVTSIPQGFNPTVGGQVIVKSGLIVKSKKPKGKIDTPKNNLLVWQEGKYVKADGIFTEVINKKGNIYKVKKVHSQKEFYLVTDGKTHAHGDTLQKAKEDFRFKLMSEKLKNEPIKKDTIITINYYRLITGACEMGVKNWMQQNKIKKESYKASELLPLLEKTNAYGLDRFKKLITF